MPLSSRQHGMRHERNRELNQKNQAWNKRIRQLLQSHFQAHTVLLLPVSLAIPCSTVLLNCAPLPAPYCLCLIAAGETAPGKSPQGSVGKVGSSGLVK